jgi:hypothetical protein
MKIIDNTFAVFWRSADHRQQFHADAAKLFPDEPVRYVAARYRQIFPSDVICSIRDKSGRFVAFRQR